MNLTATDVLNDVLTRIPTALNPVVGPPFTTPPAPPCVVVALPDISEVEGTGAGCMVTGATVDLIVVPPTATGADQLLGVVDQLVAEFGSAVTAGQLEPSPFTDLEDILVYRLTVEA